MNPRSPAPKAGALIQTGLRAHQTEPLLTIQIPTIQTLLLHLERLGRAEDTIDAHRRHLTSLAKRGNLQDPQTTALIIARYKKPDGTNATNSFKAKLVDCYNNYCKFHKIAWEKPIYHQDETGIQPPTDEQVKMLIAGFCNELSLKTQISAETGLRPIEIQGEKGLRAKNIHLDQKTITTLNTKRCNARPPIKISEELTTRLQTYITTHNLNTEDLLFKGETRRFGEHYRRARNRLAKKLNNPELKKVRLYDLRHYYITKQLRRTQNAETVRILVGHKRLNTTQRYMHLLANTNGEWECQGATTKEEAKKLIEADFTYILTTPDGTMLFKKPK